VPPWIRIAALLLAGCGLANPALRTEDGARSSGRLRAGISSMQLDHNCWGSERCTVQLTLRHLGPGRVPVEIAEVRLFASGRPLGAVPLERVDAWQDFHYGRWSGFYEPWDGMVTWPKATQLSLALGHVEWSRQLASQGLDPDPAKHEVTAEVVLRTKGEELLVRSVFSVTPMGPWRRESRIIT
jgi:hypothetical protein